MKVLVVEDTPLHQESARTTLEGHDVTVLKSYEEAEPVFAQGTLDHEAVLTDMLMPMALVPPLARSAFRQEEVPYGVFIALKAVMMGAKFVAMVTDANHHKNAMSAALDLLWPVKILHIEGARCLFMHAPMMKLTCPQCRNDTEPPRGSIAPIRPACPVCQNRYVKNWGAVLQALMADRPPSE